MKMKTDLFYLIVFFIMGTILEVIAWKLSGYEGLIGFACLTSFIGIICFLIGLWCKSDFKRWK